MNLNCLTYIMEGSYGSQREIATVSCKSSVGGQFLVTYDAPRRLSKGESSSICLKMPNKSSLRNCKSFMEGHQLKQSLLSRTSSTALDGMADDSLENSFNDEMVERQTEKEYCEQPSKNSLFKTPARTSTPISNSQMAKDRAISRKLFDNIRTKFEKGSKVDIPAIKIPKPPPTLTPALKSCQSLPRLDRTCGDVLAKKSNATSLRCQASLKPLKRPPMNLKLNQIASGVKPKIQVRSSVVEKKTPLIAKELPRVAMVRSEVKIPLQARMTPLASRVVTQPKIVSRCLTRIIKKTSDSSPPPTKSPLSPDDIAPQSASTRKKWEQSSDVKNLSTFSLFQLSSEVRKKSVDIVHMLGLNEHQEAIHDNSTSQIPVYKSSDAYTSATLRRLEQTVYNLKVLESFLKQNDLSNFKKDMNP